MALEKTYKLIKSKLPKVKVDSFNVVQKVEEYRQFWNPGKANVILLAESHVYTDDFDFEKNCNRVKLEYFIRNYPTDFVRFVYCLAYGESDLLNQRLDDNKGTPHYWKIFASCIAKDEHIVFDGILKNKTPYFPRLRNKVNTLQEMKRRGIWLLDSSIVGIYRAIDANHSTLDPKEIFETKKEIISTCWDNHLREIVYAAKPRHIIVIGKGRHSVEGILLDRLMLLQDDFAFTMSVLPQPNERGTPEKLLETYKQYQRICAKYAPHLNMR